MNKLDLNPIFAEIKSSWEMPDNTSIECAKSIVKKLSESLELKHFLAKEEITKGKELYRDHERGFVLIAYSEPKDFYRVPHNHGNSWVVYAVIEGIIEMGTYTLANQNHLIKKDKYQMESGDTQVYFPGDIHDTKCISEKVIILRFTSCDLREEEKQGRMKKFKV